MTSVNVNFYDAVNTGRDANATDGQCFDAYCSQAALEVASLPASIPAQPQAVIGTNTSYISFEPNGKVKFYCGPDADPATMQERAVVSTGFITCGVKKGQKLFIWAPV